jgi:ABC-type Zn2+ transport system substrate-binding protein/surface adhesin
MRACLVFFLALMLSLNSAYAAVMGVCDALDHTSSHDTHLGHHSHEHSDDHTHDNPTANSDEAGKTFSASDHHHDHVHPSFSYILPGIIGVMPLTGSSPIVAATTDAFISAPQAPPARPPKATLA